MSRPTNLSRRDFLRTGLAGAGAVTLPAALSGCLGVKEGEDKNLTVFAFGHGVASGDPLSDAVIIWTRVSPDVEVATEAEVAWVMASDPELKQVVASGTEYTNKNRDFTVKVDVTGLSPDSVYYYQFAGQGGALSPVGVTRTLPVGRVREVTIAACSCANYPAGMFYVYRELAGCEADVVLHLGDYIYEYGSNKYPSQDYSGRVPDPLSETITLDDYRRRYQQYRTDTDLQAAHAAKPFICIWDDHEISNDVWVGGAQNHDASEGPWQARRDAAVQAYHEWMPIRSKADLNDIHRRFQFGDLVNLNMLETRLLARSQQLEQREFMTERGLDVSAMYEALLAPERSLMGPQQMTEVLGNVRESEAVWQVLGQQIIMGRMELPVELMQATNDLFFATIRGENTTQKRANVHQTMMELTAIKKRMLQNDSTLTGAEILRVTNKAPYNLDAWDGYMAEREALLNGLRDAGANLVVLSGDTHNGWAHELNTLGADQGASALCGVEFATSSVSSPGMEGFLGLSSNPQLRADYEEGLQTLVDNLHYVNGGDRGYLVVRFTPSAAVCEWRYLDTITASSYQITRIHRLQVRPGDPRLQPA
ncbi:MAG: alkaline phosphatase [Oceanospirillaceae bacterium]|nr:alkaline phosphatase [Oceanospirillaceae bacterium]|tara:strand:- start:32329 stop:34107 length:1779 start_codon:yes stop_codon:yes gene_type:complete